MLVYRGIDKDGNTVIFADGDCDRSLIAKAEERTGNTWGEPAPDTVASPLFTIERPVVFVDADPCDVAVSITEAPVADDETMVFNHPPPEAGIRPCLHRPACCPRERRPR